MPPSVHGRRASAIAGKKTTTAACEKAIDTLEHQFQRIFADRRRFFGIDALTCRWLFRKPPSSFFFLRWRRPVFRGPMAAYRSVDFDEFPYEVFEAAEFSNLVFGLFLSSGGWQRL